MLPQRSSLSVAGVKTSSSFASRLLIAFIVWPISFGLVAASTICLGETHECIENPERNQDVRFLSSTELVNPYRPIIPPCCGIRHKATAIRQSRFELPEASFETCHVCSFHRGYLFFDESSAARASSDSTITTADHFECRFVFSRKSFQEGRLFWYERRTSITDNQLPAGSHNTLSCSNADFSSGVGSADSPPRLARL